MYNVKRQTLYIAEERDQYSQIVMKVLEEFLIVRQTIQLENVFNKKYLDIIKAFDYLIISWVESFTHLLSISVSMAVIKDFSTNYVKALGLNQHICCSKYVTIII